MELKDLLPKQLYWLSQNGELPIIIYEAQISLIHRIDAEKCHIDYLSRAGFNDEIKAIAQSKLLLHPLVDIDDLVFLVSYAISYETAKQSLLKLFAHPDLSHEKLYRVLDSKFKYTDLATEVFYKFCDISIPAHEYHRLQCLTSKITNGCFHFLDFNKVKKGLNCKYSEILIEAVRCRCPNVSGAAISAFLDNPYMEKQEKVDKISLAYANIDRPNGEIEERQSLIRNVLHKHADQSYYNALENNIATKHISNIQ